MAVNVYQLVTDRIINQLETGTVPWRQPWSKGAGLGEHQNLISQHQYRGINSLLTGSQGYQDPFWLTFKQSQSLGGSVRKGEKGTPIVYWMFGTKQEENGTEKRWGFAKYSTVFNVSQCEGLEEAVSKAKANRKSDRIEFKPIEACENIVKTYQAVPIEFTQQRAFYRPSTDSINMPKPESFDTIENYYAVLFHELTHSTGHATRLNRPGIVSKAHFGDHSYSKEELVAELGSAFLCAKAGIDTPTIDQAASYIKSWLKALKDDPKMIIQASSAAQAAADLIQGIQAKTEETKDGV
jgi:antirestriction protein ArdC